MPERRGRRRPPGMPSAGGDGLREGNNGRLGLSRIVAVSDGAASGIEIKKWVKPGNPPPPRSRTLKVILQRGGWAGKTYHAHRSSVVKFQDVET